MLGAVSPLYWLARSRKWRAAKRPLALEQKNNQPSRFTAWRLIVLLEIW